MQVSITGVAAGKLAKTHRAKVEKDVLDRAKNQSSGHGCTVDLNKSTEAVYNFTRSEKVSVQVTQVRDKA